MVQRDSFDVLVVGSGPGGATVARQLAATGQRVLILERGQDHRGRWYYGNLLGAALCTERLAFHFTRQHTHLVCASALGGGTNLYAGCATPPPAWLGHDFGIDLEGYARDLWSALGIVPLPEERLGAASTRLAQAARALGQDWQPQPKLMRAPAADAPSCSASCMMGCRCRAKWNAAEWVDEAVGAGAELLTGALVTDVILEGRQAVGVIAERRGETLHLRADRVVLAAGGLSTPRILQRAGVRAAGIGLALDPTVIVYGRGAGAGNAMDPPMTWASREEQLGVMFSTIMDPRPLFPVMALWGAPRRGAAALHYARTLGVMIKLTDEVSGEIPAQGPIDKPLSPRETERLELAQELARRILREAGADPGTFLTTPRRGTHPSATARIDEVVDRDLQTAIAGLYVCDASVFPRALGQPTVITIICLALRLSDHLLGRNRFADSVQGGMLQADDCPPAAKMK